MEMEFLTRKALTDLNQSQKYNAIITIHPLHSALVDASLISQVMANLLSNAIKYSSKNKTPVIEVKSRIENDTIVYSVRDNGVGFDMKYAHKLFNIFERLHTDKEFEGTGIGLAIVKRIIQKHGGSIWAEGDIDKGATFYFSLPKTNHPPHPINGNNLQKSPTIRFEKEF
jgi:light-regulated signal transduction histidine kinase (bacteriophytochrome)